MTLYLDQLPEEVKKKRIEKAKNMPGKVPQGLIICSSKVYNGLFLMSSEKISPIFKCVKTFNHLKTRGSERSSY